MQNFVSLERDHYSELIIKEVLYNFCAYCQGFGKFKFTLSILFTYFHLYTY